MQHKRNILSLKHVIEHRVQTVFVHYTYTCITKTFAIFWINLKYLS